MSTSKILAAAIAAAFASFAFAQSAPPKPATDPAVGAGQRSTQNTPMGSTGTPGGSGAAAQGSTAGSTAASTAGSTGASSAGSMNSGSGTAASSGMSSGSMATGSGSGSSGTKARKTAKADRG